MQSANPSTGSPGNRHGGRGCTTMRLARNTVNVSVPTIVLYVVSGFNRTGAARRVRLQSKPGPRFVLSRSTG
jgi:hypothetical protein